jgi:hypothetical protein
MRSEPGTAAAPERIWSLPLVRHLAIVVAAKLAFLFLLWFLFFRQPVGMAEPAEDIGDHIAGPRSTVVSNNTIEVKS